MSIYKLEDRVLFDAAAAVDAAEAQEVQAVQPEHVEAQDAAATEDSNINDAISELMQDDYIPADVGIESELHDYIDAYMSQPEAVTSEPDAPKLILISDRLENAGKLYEAASEAGNLAVIYDTDNTSADQLIQQIESILDGQKASSIAIAAEGDSSGNIDVLEADSDSAFWKGITDYVNADGRIDFMGSNLADSNYINAVAELTGLDVAASDDATGSAGDWYLEQGNVDLGEVYFDGLPPADINFTVNAAAEYHELVIINSSVADAEEIIDDLDSGVEVLRLGEDTNALEQINDYLDSHNENQYDTIRIISHGNEGYFVLNGEIIDTAYAAEHQAEFAALGEHLSADGDLMLYGCNLAANAEGQDLIDMISELTGADVAASTNDTSNAFDGDWHLEYTTGLVTTDAITVEGYDHHLASTIVTDNSQTALTYALANIAYDGEIYYRLTPGTAYWNVVFVSNPIHIHGDVIISGNLDSGTVQFVNVGEDNHIFVVENTGSQGVYFMNCDIAARSDVLNSFGVRVEADAKAYFSNVNMYGFKNVTILNYGEVVLSNVNIHDNTGPQIVINHEYLVAGNTDFYNNTVSGSSSDPEGIVVHLGSTLSLANGAAYNNTSSSSAGFLTIDNHEDYSVSYAFVENFEIYQNSGTTGGAIYFYAGGAQLNLTNCNIHDNTASVYGGGIASIGGTIVIQDSQLSNNICSYNDTTDGIWVNSNFQFKGSFSSTNNSLEFSRDVTSDNSNYKTFTNSTVYYTGTSSFGQKIAALNYGALVLEGGNTKIFQNGTTSVEQQIEITDNITLSGSSSARVTVQVRNPYGDGSGSNISDFRVFNLNLDSDKTVTIENMTIRGGDISSYTALSDNRGGAIRSLGGTVNLNNCIIEQSKANTGGGVSAENGIININNTIIQNNYATSCGGGIFNASIQMTITGGAVNGNYGGSGVALFSQGKLAIDGTHFENNHDGPSIIYFLAETTCENMVITNNNSNYYYLVCTGWGQNITFNNCDIYDNSTTSTYYGYTLTVGRNATITLENGTQIYSNDGVENTIKIDGTLVIKGDSTNPVLVRQDFDIKSTGSFSIQDGALDFGETDSFIYSASNEQEIVDYDYSNLVLKNGTKTAVNISADSLTIEKDITLSISGSMNVSSLAAGKSTVEYTGDATQTVAGLNYYNLTISGTAQRTLAGNIGIAGSFTADNTNFAHGNYTVTYNGANQNVVALDYYGLAFSGSGIKSLDGDIAVSGDFTSTAGATLGHNNHTVTYNGGDQAVAALNYYRLVFEGDGSTKTFHDGTTSVEQHIAINEAMTITGSDSDNVTVQVLNPYEDGAGTNVTASRVFYIDAASQIVNVSNITIKGGDISGGECPDAIERRGGGIYICADSTLNLDSVVVSGAKAYLGGGIFAVGNLNITNGSQVTANTSYLDGGGIYIEHNSTVLISGNATSVSNNESQEACGGAIYSKGTLTVDGALFDSNTARGGGGGITGYSGSVTIQNGARFYRQSTEGYGGAIRANSGVTLTITGADTVLGGSDGMGNTSGASGGAVYATGTNVFTDITISYNQASQGGCGICISGDTTISGVKIINNLYGFMGGGIDLDGGTCTIKDGTIISGNNASWGGGIYAGSGVMNIIGSDVIIGNSDSSLANFASSGAGMAINCTVNIDGAQIIGNRGYDGKGLYIFADVTTLKNGAVVQSDTNYSADGGIYVRGGTLHVADSSPVTIGDYLYIEGDFTADNADSLIFTANRNIYYAGPAEQVIADVNYTNLYLSNSNKTAVDINADSLTVEGDITLSISGSLSASNFTAGESTVEYTGDATQTVAGLNYYNLTISGTAQRTLAGNIGIAESFTADNTNFAHGNYMVTYNGASQDVAGVNYYDLAFSGSGIKSLDGDITVSGDFTSTAGVTFGHNNHTVTYNGGVQTVAGLNYYDLVFAGTGTKTLAGNIGIAGSFTADNTNFAHGNYTVTYNGEEQSVTALNYYDLAFAGTGIKTLAGNIGIAGSFTADNTNFVHNDFAVAYNGGNQTITALDYYQLALQGSDITKTFQDGVTSVERQIEITSTITLTGSSADNVFLQVVDPGVTSSRLLYIFGSGKTININNMTLKGGDISSYGGVADGMGGTICLSYGDLNITNSVITGSTAFFGGGIDAGGNVVLNNTIIQNNTATQFGGGIYASFGTVTLQNGSKILNNSVNGNGGGICVRENAILNLNGSDILISGNRADSSEGGGIYSLGTTNIYGATIENNSALAGAGIFSNNIINISSAAIQNNSAGGIGGGGIYINSGTVTMSGNVIINNNTSDGQGDGVDLTRGTLNVESTASVTIGDKLRIAGDFNVAADASLTLMGGSRVVYYGVDQDILALDYYDLMFEHGAKTLAGDISVRGELTNYGAEFIHNSYEVNYSGANQNVAALDYYDLVFSGSGIKTLAGDIGIAGMFTADNTNFAHGNYTVAYNGGDQTVTALNYYRLALQGDNTTKTFQDGITSVEQQIKITDAVIFTGSSADNVTLQIVNPGITHSRLLEINTSGKTVDISNITLKGGNLSSYGGVLAGMGGAVHVTSGNLNLTDSVITDSTAFYGGGIYSTGNVVLDNTIIQNNTATQYGGGIYANSGTVTLQNGSQVLNNFSIHGNGGGVCVREHAILNLNGSDILISGNSCDTSQGGGIYSLGTTNIWGATIENNSALNGAGIFSNNILNINSAIIQNNSAGLLGGGGIYINNGTVTISGNTIINGNTSNGFNDGIDLARGTLSLKSTASVAIGDQLRISGDLNIASDASLTLQDGSKTIYYGGEQDIFELDYYDLVFEHGAKTLAGDISVRGELTNYGTEFIHNSYEVNYSGANQNVAALDYYNLKLSGSGTKTLAGDIGVAGRFNVDGASFAHNNHAVDYNGADQYVTGLDYYDLTLSGTGSKTLASDIGISRAFAIDSVDFVHNQYNVDYNGTNQNIVSLDYYDLILSGSGTKTLNGDIGIEGKFAVDSVNFAHNNFAVDYNGANQNIADLDYYDLTLSGTGTKTLVGDIGIADDFTVNSVNFAHANYAVDYNGANQNVTSLDYYDLTLSGTGTKTLSGDIGVAGAFTVDSVDFAHNNSVVDYNGANQNIAGLDYYDLTLSGTGTKILAGDVGITGDFMVDSVDFAHNNKTVDYNGGSQNIAGLDYYDLTLSGTGTKKLSGDIGVAGIFTAINDNFVHDNYAVNYNGANQEIISLDYYDLILSGSGTKTLAGDTGIAGEFTVDGANFAHNTFAVDYNGANQNIAGLDYYDLTLSGSGTKTLTGDIGIAGILTVDGIDFAHGNQTVTFNGGAQNINALDYYNLVFSGTGVKNLMGNIGIAGTFTATDANFVHNNFTVDYNGGDQNVASLNYHGLSFSGSGTKTLAGDITLTGDWINDVMVNCSGYSVTFDGVTQHISGTGYSCFHDLVASTTGNTLILDQDITINGVLDLDQGVVDIGTYTLTLTEGITGDLSNLHVSEGTINYAGNVIQVIAGITYHNLILSNSVLVTATDINADNLTMSNGAILKLTGSLNVGNFTAGNGTVNYAGGDQTISRLSYNSLILSGSGTKTFLDGSTSVANNIIVNDSINITGEATLPEDTIKKAVVQVLTPGANGTASRAFYIDAGSNDVSISNLTIKGGDISSLSGVDSYGGALYIKSGNVSMDQVTIDSAKAVNGGSIYLEGGSLEMTNSTIFGNIATNAGGGIYIKGGDLSLMHVTVAGNTAVVGGGIFNDHGGLEMTNSIVGYNTGTTAYDDIEGSIDSTTDYNVIGGRDIGSHNVYFDYDSRKSLFDSYTTVNSNLVPLLADNGGATMTVALSDNSVAIGAGRRGMDVPDYDQRGVEHYNPPAAGSYGGEVDPQKQKGAFNLYIQDFYRVPLQKFEAEQRFPEPHEEETYENRQPEAYDRAVEVQDYYYEDLSEIDSFYTSSEHIDATASHKAFKSDVELALEELLDAI